LELGAGVSWPQLVENGIFPAKAKPGIRRAGGPTGAWMVGLGEELTFGKLKAEMGDVMRDA
jgi:hypothetical protein